MNQPTIQAVKDYILTCPHLDELADSNVDDSGNRRITYAIHETMNDQGSITHYFMDDSTERQFLFSLACVFEYDKELATKIEYSGFFEDFEEWLEQNNVNNRYPVLKEGLTPTNIETTSNGYLVYEPESSSEARYEIQCKLIYEKEANE